MSDLIKAAVEEMNKLEPVQENVVYEKPEQEHADDTTPATAITEALAVSIEKRIKVTSEVKKLTIHESTSDYLSFTAEVNIERIVDGYVTESVTREVEAQSTAIAGGPGDGGNDKTYVKVTGGYKPITVRSRGDILEEVKQVLAQSIYEDSSIF